MRVWIDTDVGSDVDDALAIAYVLRQPTLELVGVSTVFGDVALRTRIARRLLELADAAHVTVVTGLGRPLAEDRLGRMFGHEGLGLVDDPSPQMKTTQNPDVEATLDRLAKTVETARADALVSIGPMTNLGALVRRGVALPALTIMGGHIDRSRTWPGMIESIPEWNWWCDPEAVQASLEAEPATPPRILPGEVTFGTRLLPEDLDRFAGGDPLARALGVLCDHWLVAQRERLGASDPRVHLHDPLAAATLVDPGLVPWAERRIRIDSAGVTHTVADGTPVLVGQNVDNAELRAHLMGTWLGSHE
jgi:purine nucleosidase